MRPDKLVLQAGVGERADSLEAAPWGLQVLSLLCSSGGTPAGTWHNMAASNLALEMRSIGERLLYKLQTLPQAEPVEIVAFSVLVIFIGKLRLPESPQRPWLFLASRRDETMVPATGLAEVAGWSPRQRRRSRCPLGGARGSPLILTCCSRKQVCWAPGPRGASGTPTHRWREQSSGGQHGDSHTSSQTLGYF